MPFQLKHAAYNEINHFKVLLFFFFFATSRLPDLTFNQSHNDLLSHVNVNNFIKMVAELPNLQWG